MGSIRMGEFRMASGILQWVYGNLGLDMLQGM